MIDKIGIVVFTNLMPSVGQMSSIATGLHLGLDPLTVLLVSLSVNCLLFFPVFFGLHLFYKKLLSRIKLFKKYLFMVRKKGKPYVNKYGVFGLTVFIAMPGPLTGTYTASVLAWLIGLEWKKSFIAITLGSFIGAMIILSSYLGLFRILTAIGG